MLGSQAAEAAVPYCLSNRKEDYLTTQAHVLQIPDRVTWVAPRHTSQARLPRVTASGSL